MTLPALVTVPQFAAWVGEELSPTDGHAAALLDGASALVRSYTGQTWVDDEGELETVPGEVTTVVSQVTERKWRNPAGYVQDTTGPYTVRYSEQTVQGMYLTDAEKAMLAPLKDPDKRPALWTQPLSAEDPYLDVLTRDLPALNPLGGG